MVADQVLDGRVLDLGGVEVHAAVRVVQRPMASWVTLRSCDKIRKKIVFWSIYKALWTSFSQVSP